VLLPIAYGVAVVAVALLLLHVARRFGNAPARVPLNIAYDGRPYAYGPRAVLWLAPAIVAAIVAILGVEFSLHPPPPAQQPTLTLVFVVLTEIAWLVGWLVDRQIELARKMSFRIAPARMLLVMLPLFGTIGATLAVAALSG